MSWLFTNQIRNPEQTHSIAELRTCAHQVMYVAFWPGR
jgi:hypothetical protein